LESVTVLLLAIAVSFDSLAIGMTYGMARITIPILPRILLSAISFVSIFIAMLIGDLFISWLSPEATKLLGGGILILLGIYTLWRTYQQSEYEPFQPKESNPDGVFINTVMNVFKDPLAADYDCSKTISLYESVFLGIALAFDAFAAGIGAAILSFPHLPTSTAVMIASFIFLSIGLLIGNKIHRWFQGLFFKWLPGTIILLIGIAKIFS
jgi:putative sporulation protein YtaF